MTAVKQEEGLDTIGSEGWLSYWANPQLNIKKGEEDMKPQLMMDVESDVDDSSSDEYAEEEYNEETKEKQECTKRVPVCPANFLKKNRRQISKSKMRKVLASAPVSRKVADLCEFQCPRCHKIFTKRRKLNQHLRDEEKGQLTMTRRNFVTILTKVTAHECNICQKRVLCDIGTIKHHLRRHQSESNYKDNKSSHQLVTEALENTTVSFEIDDLCEYQCPKCDTNFTSRKKMLTHFKKTEHAELTRRNIFTFLTNITAYQCGICSKKILCDISTIRSHLKCHNRISLKQYGDKFNVPFECKRTKLRKKKESDLSSAMASKKFKVTEKLGNLCKFQCPRCDFSSHEWRAMTRHLNCNAHGPILSPPNYATNLVVHKCQLCSELVLCDISIFQKHVERQHKETVPKYKSMINLHCRENCLPQYMSNLRSVIQDIPSFQQCQILHLKPQSLPESKVTKHVGNITFYKCPFCHKADMSYNCLWLHCRKKHNGKQVSKTMELVVEGRFHRCHICAKTILCDNSFVRNHVSRLHNLTFTQYIKKHVLRNGFKAIPTYQEYTSNRNVFDTFLDDTKSQVNEHDSDKDLLIQPCMLSSESEESISE